MAFSHKISKALRSLFNKPRPALSSPAPLFLTPKLQEPPFAVPVKISSPELDLQENRRLYAAMKTGEILIPAVTLSPMAVMRWKAVEGNWAAEKTAMEAVRPRVYRRFCAGEEEEEDARAVRRLWKGRMRGIFYYGLEGEGSGAAGDWNLAGVYSAVDLAASLPSSSQFFVGEKAEEAAKTLRWLRNGQFRGIINYGGAAGDRNLAGLPLILEMTATPSPSSAHFTCVKIAGISALNQLGSKDGFSHLPMKKPSLQVLIDAADLPLLVNADYILIRPAKDQLGRE